MGFDLNRVWQDPSPWAHPELFAAKSQVLSYDKDPVIFCKNKNLSLTRFFKSLFCQSLLKLFLILI